MIEAPSILLTMYERLTNQVITVSHLRRMEVTSARSRSLAATLGIPNRSDKQAACVLLPIPCSPTRGMSMAAPSSRAFLDLSLSLPRVVLPRCAYKPYESTRTCSRGTPFLSKASTTATTVFDGPAT